MFFAKNIVGGKREVVFLIYYLVSINVQGNFYIPAVIVRDNTSIEDMVYWTFYACVVKQNYFDAKKHWILRFHKQDAINK